MPANLPGERILARLYLRSTDLIHTQCAHDWIVTHARKAGLAGATVLEGIAGFGSRGVLPLSPWHVSTPRPVIVELVEDVARLFPFLANTLFPLLHHGTITLERAAVLMYRHRDLDRLQAPLQLHDRIADLSTLPAFPSTGSTAMQTTDGILLRIFAGESDQVDNRPLHEVLIAKARELGLAGATVLKGSMGFGAHSVLHTTKLLELSTDLPIVIELVDTEEKIQTLLPHVQEMVKEGLITMETVRILPCGTRAVGSTAS